VGTLQADHPAFVFQVVGLSRDDALTVVQAGGDHPGSQYVKYPSQPRGQQQPSVLPHSNVLEDS
jgi:hypothetical protein